MGQLFFVNDGPQAKARSERIREQEKSQALSFASRVSLAKKKKQNRIGVRDEPRAHGQRRSSGRKVAIPSAPVCTCARFDEYAHNRSPGELQRHCPLHNPQEYVQSILHACQAIVVAPAATDAWRTQEERIAFQHWQSVTAPWQAHFHGSPQSKFWEVVIPRLAHKFVPVKYLLLSFEMMDLPAFYGETIAARREKLLGNYNAAIKMLRTEAWPQVCIIVTCLLAYVLELRSARLDNARMHLESCQKLITDFKYGNHEANDSPMFVDALEDTARYGNNFVRLHTRWRFLQKTTGWKSPQYGIETMPETRYAGSLSGYLLEFEIFADDLFVRNPSNLISFDSLAALNQFDRWDDLVHQLCQLGKITNSVTTAAFMLFYIGLFLIPFTDRGVSGIYPDAMVLDHILHVFQDQILRPLGVKERSDIETVVRLGLKTILRFPHEPRHVVEIESITSLIEIGKIIGEV